LGHKVNPTGFRLGVIRGWDSRWYAGRNYKDLVYEDHKLRQLIQKRLANAAVSRIEIERLAGTQLSVTIHTAKPGIVIGKSGENVERLRQLLEQTSKKKVRLSILEIRNPEVDATLIAHSIAEQIEKRISFRRAMKQAVQKAMRANAKGIKVIIGGRLGGAEIARTEKEVEGSVPLQTLRANIDYGLAEAHTTYGVIGIKVWVYHGDVLPERQREQGLGAAQAQMAAVPAPGGRGGPRGEGRGGPRGESRGGPRGESRGAGAGGPRGGGPRPGSTEAGPRPSGGRGIGPGGQSRGARGSGPAGAERAPRGAPRAAPDGGIIPGKGPELPPSGDVVPAPGAYEFPAPEANAPSDAAQVETTPHPTETEE
jgi:small subunit ribosomal protein S3